MLTPNAKTTAPGISAAECWVVQPSDPPQGFFDLVGYLLHAGVDVAFGPGDVLPGDLPESYDGIRCIVVSIEDLPRLRKRLRGFRGLDPDSDVPPEVHSHGTMFLHEDDTTWLAVWTEEGCVTPKRIENPLIVAPDLTIDSPRLRERLLRRPDREIHGQLIDGLLTTNRFEWSDISFGTLWAHIGAYEATGDETHLRAAQRFFDAQRAYAREHPQQRGAILIAALPLLRMTQITGDPAYLNAVPAGSAEIPNQHLLRTGGPYLLQAHSFVHPETREHLVAHAADGGSYSEPVGLYYPSVLAVACAAGWGVEAADRIGPCLREHRAICRDDATGLYYHGVLGRRNHHRGVLGHGMLWTCFGLVHLVELWPKGHGAYESVLTMFRDACRAAASVQDPQTGEFHHILDLPQTPYGRIYTPALAYVFLRGARLGFLSAEFTERGQMAWSAVKRHIFQGGSFGADGGAAQSKQFQHYLLQPMTYDFRAVRGKSFWQLHAANEIVRLTEGR